MKPVINQYSAEELRAMTPFLLIFNGAAAAVCVVLGIVFGFDWRLYTGLITGNALMLANFLLIGYTVGKILKCRDFRRGRFLGNLSYGLRYIGIFAVLALLLTFGLINPVTGVIPLFYPKLYYTFFYIKLNSRKEDEGS